MKIYDKSKVNELNKDKLDLTLGYLQHDKLFIEHHEAIPEQKAVYKDRIVEEPSGGISIYKDLVSPYVEAKEAWDEYEEIQVYIAYTEEELKDRLRYKRVSLLDAFDKWEKAVLRGREQDDYSIMVWYQDLLDLKENSFNNIPSRIQYYYGDK